MKSKLTSPSRAASNSQPRQSKIALLKGVRTDPPITKLAKSAASTLTVFHGMNSTGLAVFSDETTSFMGRGMVWRKKNITLKGKPGHLLIPLAGMPLQNKAGEVAAKMDCVHAITGEMLVFKGIVPQLNSAVSHSAAAGTTAITAKTKPLENAATVLSPPVAANVTPRSTSGSRRQRRSAATAKAKLDAVAAFHLAGFGADLKIHEVCALVNESRATVYRKVQLQIFPPPQKRGRSSFWKSSHIEAYRNGTWNPAGGDASNTP